MGPRAADGPSTRSRSIQSSASSDHHCTCSLLSSNFQHRVHPFTSFYFNGEKKEKKKVETLRREFPYSTNSYFSPLTASIRKCPAFSLVVLGDLLRFLSKAKPFHYTLIPPLLTYHKHTSSNYLLFFLINNIYFPIGSFPTPCTVLNYHPSHKNRTKPPWTPHFPVATALPYNKCS